jgi:uncharacterized membrane protein
MAPSKNQRRARVALGALFLSASVVHATNRKFFAKLIPSPSMSRYENVIDPGTEVVLAVIGLTMFVPGFQMVARLLPTAFLVPTFPAAINQVRHPERMKELGLPPIVVAARIPVQAGVLALVWWATRRPVLDD